MKTENKRHFKGSVLFTVVSVMSLLIIFLMGTLVLATSASNRAHKNYTSSQTEFTSRTVVDSVLNAVTVDEAFAEAICNISSTAPTLTVPVQIQSSTTNAGSMGTAEDVRIEYYGTKQYAVQDEESKEWSWEAKDVLKMTATVNLAGESGTTTAYLIKDPPKTSGATKGGAGFVTTGGASFACQTNLYGGSYINIPELDEAKTYDYTDPSTYLTGEMITFPNTGSSVEADTVINANMNLGQISKIFFPGQGTGLTIWGDLNYGEKEQTKYFSNLQSASPSSIAFNKIPYIYVDGRIYGTGNDKTKIGNLTDPFPLNVFCDYIQAEGNGFQARADIYCMGEGKTSTIKTLDTKLYSWTASVINRAANTNGSYTSGNIYSNGNVEITKGTITGDIKADGYITLENVTVLGEVVSGGNLTLKNCRINGDVVSGGNLIMENCTVFGNVISKGNADITTSKMYLNLAVVGAMEVDEDSLKYVVNVYNDPTSGDTYDKLKPEYSYYVNDVHIGEILPGYTAKENTYHDNAVKFGYDMYDNEPIPYEEYDPTQNLGPETNWQPADKAGNVVGWGIKLYYISETEYYDFIPYYQKDADGNPTDTVTNETVIYYNSSGTEVEEWEAKGSYYTEWNDPMTETDKQYYYYNAMNEKVEESEAIPEYYFTRPSDPNTVVAEGVTFYLTADASQTPVDKSVAVEVAEVGDAGGYAAAYATTETYPAYAEKQVLLGLKQLKDSAGNTIPVADTQVVKTMAEILENVVNPYDYSDMPTMFTETITQLRTNGEVIDSVNELKTLTNKVVTSLYDGTTASGAKKVKVTYKDYKTGDTTNDGAPVIDRSCILKLHIGNGGELADGDGNKEIVINPGSGEICVVIDEFSMGNGVKFIVDDSAGGSVNFYVSPNATMSLESGITTTSYMQLLEENYDFQVFTDSNYARTTIGVDPTTGAPKTVNDPPSIQELGVENPKVYVYGGDESELKISNFEVITANIISPNLYLNVASTSTNVLGDNAVYYNGDKVDSNYRYIIGCCNSEETTFPNQINAVYVPDSGGGPSYDTPDKTHWFKVLYYDEH